MISVALIGPDGAGKSTVSERLRYEPLPAPMKRIYMGVNLEASGVMLPTTRLVLALKRARGGRPDLTVAAHREPSPVYGSRRALRVLVSGTRMGLWVAEEWFRQLMATSYRFRGNIVVFDRHFFADYYHHDVAGEDQRSMSSKLHGFLLRHVYPRPDVVICLDAPGAVLHRRKGESSPEWLDLRRQQYLQLEAVVPRFAVVDVDRPLDMVMRDVTQLITRFCEEKRS